MNEIESFTQKVKHAREEYNHCTTDGEITPSLKQELVDLAKEEESLMQKVMPQYRAKILNQRDMHADTSILLSSMSILEESNLSADEVEFCRILSETEMEEPDFSFCPQFDASYYACMFYMEVHNEEICFAFGDDGTVIFLENDNGWKWRKKPVLKECFGQKAVMESNESCLLEDLDGQILRLHVNRIKNIDDLYREPIYE